MKSQAAMRFPDLAELGEFGRSEFANGIADIRHALIDEAWFGRAKTSHGRSDSHSLGWDIPEGREAEGRSQDPFKDRWSDHDRERVSPEHVSELDFDR